MQIPENEVHGDELERLLDDEDHAELERSDVPDDVKAEVDEGLERRRDTEIEDEIGDDAESG